MLILFTGVPGASKTLNAIKFVSEDAQFKDRPVYYYNIKDLTLDWLPLSSKEVLVGDADLESISVFEWYKLPEGSVIFIDECQAVFPQRSPRDPVPEHVKQLNVHRHKGMDIIIITQHPKLIDAAVRRLVGAHYHFERAFGFNRARRLHWQECQDDIKDYHNRKLAITKNVKFDKKYFGVYKSAEVHTHKAKIPAKIYFIAGLVVFVLAGFGYFFNKFSNKIDEAPAVAQQADTGVSKVRSKSKKFEPYFPVDPVEYSKLYEPRIAGLAHTAPIYDQLTKPKRAPKTICIRYHKSDVTDCKCFTEQATRLNVPLNQCNHLVDNRYYDASIPP